MSTLQDLTNTTAAQVFGLIDVLKLRSSLTLFALASDQSLFQAALVRWFGSPDQRTIDLLSASSASAEQGVS